MEINKIHTINPLFDFQILCDTDLGLYRLIKREFYNRETFNSEIFEADSLDFVKSKIISRREMNPLNLFCREGIMTQDELDDLYKEFLDTEYDNIIKLSPPTAVMNIAITSNKIARNLINSVILCRDKVEIEWIHKYDNKLKCILSDYDNLDITKYDTIYIKDICILLLFKQESIDLKNIYIARYLFNFEETNNNRLEIPLIEVAKRYHVKNKFFIINVYKEVLV